MATETAERPLISFVLLAYNQEKYIREAIEGAFSQSYSPLEIILSDDCSTDRTFEIISEMADSYTGPHQLVTSRNRENLGLIAHCNEAWSRAKGALVLNAAGDDVSLPWRAELAFRAWRENPNAQCMAFSVEVLREPGFPPYGHPANPLGPESWEHCVWQRPSGPGSTLAWHRELQEIFGPISNEAAPEDSVLLARAWLTGGLMYSNQVVVKYRKHFGSAGTGSLPSQLPETRESMRVLANKSLDYHIGFLYVLGEDLLTARQTGYVTKADYRSFEMARRRALRCFRACRMLNDNNYLRRFSAVVGLLSCFASASHLGTRALLSSIAAAVVPWFDERRLERMIKRRRQFVKG